MLIPLALFRITLYVDKFIANLDMNAIENMQTGTVSKFGSAVAELYQFLKIEIFEKSIHMQSRS